MNRYIRHLLVMATTLLFLSACGGGGSNDSDKETTDNTLISPSPKANSGYSTPPTTPTY